MPVLVSLWHKQTTSTFFDVIHNLLNNRSGGTAGISHRVSFRLQQLIRHCGAGCTTKSSRVI